MDNIPGTAFAAGGFAYPDSSDVTLFRFAGERQNSATQALGGGWQ